MSSIAANANPERTNKWLLIGAIAAAAITGVLVFAAVANFAEDDGGASASDGDAQVLVAKETIRVGTKLEADMFRVANFAEEDLVPEAVSNPEAVVGQTTTGDILKGQQLSRSQLAQVTEDARADQLAFKIPEGHLGVGVKVDEVSAVGGLVVPGDRVDIFLTVEEKESNAPNARKFRRVTAILQNVLVVAVEQTDVDRFTRLPGEQAEEEQENPLSGQDFEQRPEDAEPEEGLNSVSVALLPEQVPLLEMSDESGEISLALRKFGDNEIRRIPDFVIEIFE